VNATERNYLEEAIRILKGESLLLPEPAHLIALNESRVYWRTAALAKPTSTAARLATIERRAS
jgi:hypothetical protein